MACLKCCVSAQTVLQKSPGCLLNWTLSSQQKVWYSRVIVKIRFFLNYTESIDQELNHRPKEYISRIDYIKNICMHTHMYIFVLNSCNKYYNILNTITQTFIYIYKT